MKKCANCGVGLSAFSFFGPNGDICMTCNQEMKSSPRYTEKIGAAERQKAEIDAIVLTTETAPSLPIKRRIEIVTAECAFGMNIFKDLFAGVRDIVGGRSEAVQKTMRASRRTVLSELKKEAHAVGANAVVGVDLDYVELSSAGSMVMLVASGTAVVIEESSGFPDQLSN
ncbi:heavy metal-binding domain-containing protein [Minwuia sp. IMCC4030]|uniref:YbjQ family protein n=1 Tax=Minwuia sp. IMCC4030 TaxID=3040677 RepID=UPI0032B04C10